MDSAARRARLIRALGSIVITRVQRMSYNDDAKDVLWKFYQDYLTQMRHYEMQRSTVTNLLLLVAAAVLAFITYDKVLSRSDLPLTGLLVIIGLFGAAFSLKHYERTSFHIERARK